MHAQYVPALTDIAPLLLIRELPQDEYPTPALPRPFTSHDVEPVMFGVRTYRTSQVNLQRLLTIRQGPKKARFASEVLLTVLTRITTVGTSSTLMHQVQMACMDPRRQYSLLLSGLSCASSLDA